jgi:hypothetical protein
MGIPNSEKMYCIIYVFEIIAFSEAYLCVLSIPTFFFNSDKCMFDQFSEFLIILCIEVFL